jgi:hypothetical protein
MGILFRRPRQGAELRNEERAMIKDIGTEGLSLEETVVNVCLKLSETAVQKKKVMDVYRQSKLFDRCPPPAVSRYYRGTENTGPR